jgi:hypothetical protein
MSRAVVTACAIVVGTCVGSASAQRVYWTQAVDTGGEVDRIELRSAGLDGSDVETLMVVEDARLPSGVALDPLAGRVYFAIECGAGCVSGVWRVNLDGREQEHIIDAPVVGLDLDPVARTLYYTTWVEPEGRRIWRSNLDGSDPQALIEANARGLAIDRLHRKLYWTTWIERSLVRAGLDGSDRETIAAFDGAAGFVSVDSLAGRVYWPAGATALRCDLDGANLQSARALNRVSAYKGIGIDPRANATEVYMTTWYDFGSSVREIVRFAEGRCFDVGACLFEGMVDLPVDSRDVGDLVLDLWGRGRGLSVEDVGPLTHCLAGPGADRPADCFSSDLDGDGGIDLFDFALLQRHSGG